jgi:hypothetical protein
MSWSLLVDRLGARRVLLAVVIAAVVVVGLVPSATAPPASAQRSERAALLDQQSAAAATALRPVAPCRLFDARQTPDAGRIDATTVRIQVTGRCGVPTDATAAAISLVATNVTAPGFLTVWGSPSVRPDASNLNFVRGNTVANSAVVQLSAAGTVDVYTSVPADVIVDVTAVFVPTPIPVGPGRFVASAPRRLLDTRSTGGRGTGGLRVPLPPGVAPDAVALAVSVTAVDAAAPGFLTAHPAGTARPDVSVVNTDRFNTTRANALFVPVTSDGIDVFRSMETDVIVDLWGWFTGPSAASSTDGLFVPQSPSRVWDSRSSLDPLHAGGTVEKVATPPDAAAVVVNLTALEPTRPGFMSVYAAGTASPNVSSVNYRWRQPVAALTVSAVSDRGLAVYSFAGSHVLVDVAGWFTGVPVGATEPPRSNPGPPADTEVIFISDSSFAGIRWNGGLPFLQGAAFDNRLESCRRLFSTSCRGREGYAPLTAVEELSWATPGRYRIAVIATGYNDWASLFPRSFDALMSVARTKGIDRVVWLTYRENVGYVSPAGISNSDSFVANNRVLYAAAGSGEYPELILADWHWYSFTRPDWLTADGVHLTVPGARAAAAYVSRKLAWMERRPCPVGIGGPTAPGGWCADPDTTGPWG